MALRWLAYLIYGAGVVSPYEAHGGVGGGAADGAGGRVRYLWCAAAGAGWRSQCSSCNTAAMRAAPGPRTRARRAWM